MLPNNTRSMMIKRLAAILSNNYKHVKPEVLLDANILYKPTLNYLFCRMFNDGICGMNLTEINVAEWRGRKIPEDDPGVIKLKRHKAFIPEEDYTEFMPIAKCCVGDVTDAHILAAAFRYKLKYIVTQNSKDFKEDQIKQFVEGKKSLQLVAPAIIHPDDLLIALYISNPEAVVRSIHSTINDMNDALLNIHHTHFYKFLNDLKKHLEPERQLDQLEFPKAIEDPPRSLQAPHTATDIRQYQKVHFPEYIQKHPARAIQAFYHSELPQQSVWTARSVEFLAKRIDNHEKITGLIVLA